MLSIQLFIIYLKFYQFNCHKMFAYNKNKVVPGNLPFAQKLALMKKSQATGLPTRMPIRKEDTLLRSSKETN